MPDAPDPGRPAGLTMFVLARRAGVSRRLARKWFDSGVLPGWWVTARPPGIPPRDNDRRCGRRVSPAGWDRFLAAHPDLAARVAERAARHA